MDKREDGGPAFPGEASGMHGPNQGMSLRDWFAGQALAGFLAQVSGEAVQNSVSKAAYIVADAMLKAR